MENLQPAGDDAAQEPAAMAAQKPENIPSKFWDDDNGEIRIDRLINSYKELERKMSNSLPAPTSPNSQQKLREALGAPSSPEDYKTNIDAGLLEPNDEVNQRFFEKMFTVDQVQLVYELAGEFVIPMIAKVAAEYQADMEIERLVEKFGGTEQWQEVSRQLMAFGQQNLPQNVFENLASSYDGVMALYKMMRTDEPGLAKEAAAVSASDEKMLQSMMRDPKYWRDKDPAFIEKVSKGFENLYGQQNKAK